MSMASRDVHAQGILWKVMSNCSTGVVILFQGQLYMMTWIAEFQHTLMSIISPRDVSTESSLMVFILNQRPGDAT